MYSSDFKKEALSGLSGNWAVAVGAGFVASLLGAGTAFMGGGSGSSSVDDTEYLSPAAALIILIVLLISLLLSIAQFIIGGAVTLGYVKFNLDLVNGNRPQFNDLFSQFHCFGQAFLMQFLRSIFIALWTLLFIIPGIIASYRYAMAPYIMYENPQMSAIDAINESKALMDGNKWRLFCLNFSFIGWAILAVFTLGIGFLWLVPYQEAAFASFYQEIKEERNRKYNYGNTENTMTY